MYIYKALTAYFLLGKLASLLVCLTVFLFCCKHTYYIKMTYTAQCIKKLAYLLVSQSASNSTSLLGSEVTGDVGLAGVLLTKLFIDSSNISVRKQTIKYKYINSSQSLTLDLVVWLKTVNTRAMDFRTNPILPSLVAVPPTTLEVLS